MPVRQGKAGWESTVMVDWRRSLSLRQGSGGWQKEMDKHRIRRCC